MEVFFFELAPGTSEKRLDKYLGEKLRFFGIQHFIFEKKRRNNFAILTLLDVVNGERFLQAYSDNGKGLFLDKPFRCKRNRYKADPYKLRSMEKRLTDLAKKTLIAHGPPTVKQFVGSSVSCGVWDYPDGNLTFVPSFMILRPLRIYFGKKELAVIVDPIDRSFGERELRIGIDYSSIHGLTSANMQDSSIMLTLYYSPKFYKEGQELTNGVHADPALSEMNRLTNGLFRSLRLDMPPRPPKRIRISALNNRHAMVASSCYVYALKLSPDHIQAIKNLLHRKTFLPDIVVWPFWNGSRSSARVGSYRDLVNLLQNSLQHVDFSIRFQLQRLAQNLYLLPHIVDRLIPKVLEFEQNRGVEATVYALQQFSKRIDYAGAASEADLFTISNLEALLNAQDDSYDTLSPFALARRYSHLVLIHRARITPTSVYLEGPYAETKNAILDRYPDFALQYFLRVTFEDENGEPLRYEPNVDLSEIHSSRFRSILDGNINVAGRKFMFLGFSHSSLRDQSCWFCAPFIKDGSLVYGRALINELGDFTAIRSPAKCAARIGQAFTDLNDNVHLARTAIRRIADVERSDRCFSDGCSVASEAVFRKLWKGYKPGASKPKLFQIRYGGVKGMISLDKSLKGEIINVRPSQDKFPSDAEWLGVCGAAKRPLPLYLNRPLIKVLEDLGVDKNVFLGLQQDAMNELRAIARSPVNASAFLSLHDIAKSSNLAWLVKELHHMGIPVLDDHFLWSAIELVLVMRFGDLKYRGRIPIENGATLFGIMDETGILAEREVYCALSNGDIIQGHVAVTRSPVMHPGDIQYARAVDVPADSRLKDLQNCIVFSQHGARDLPSQLSGGDLDGDIFNIIADARILPRRTVDPADYPRPHPIDIGRPVETKDITSFFIDFLSNDQLGRISHLHLQFADQKLRGSESPECIVLANLHSVAVDFSKTGVPVTSKAFPRLDSANCKPDFMAPGPRVLLMDGVAALEGDDANGLYYEDEDDILRDLDPEGPKTRYYESQKVLGHLYRALDEHKFLREVQTGKREGVAAPRNALEQVFQYVKDKTRGFTWDHEVSWALEIKEQYENAVSDMMFANSLNPQKPLSEIEVFIGHVMGKNGNGGSKRARETSRTVREHFDELVGYTTECILKGDEEEFNEQALERSIACLSVAVGNVSDVVARVGKLESFGYLAATICLRQVKRFSKDGF